VGYALLAKASGDLNRDTVPDKILVLQTSGADTINGRRKWGKAE
jgi:hypothetical protein